MSNILMIKANETYQEVLKDSFGGVMYNVANHDKYDPESVAEIIELWETADHNERAVAGGIMKGAIGFLKEGE